MARPKDRRLVLENERFLARCAKEEAKLVKAVCLMLHNDMKNLFMEELHSNLTLKTQQNDIKLHKFILKSRNMTVYRKILSFNTESNVEQSEVTLPKWVDGIALKAALMSMYTSVYKDYKGFTGEDPITDSQLTADIFNILTDKTISNADQNINTSGKNTTEPDRSNLPVDLIDSDAGEEIQVDNHITPVGQSLISLENKPFLEIVNSNGADFIDGAVNPQSEFQQLADSKNEFRDDNKVQESRQTNDIPDLIKMTYDIKLPHRPCDYLGEALLRGFLKEQDCDCVVQVAGSEFKAHKCILSARSSYFRAMLGGSWFESSQIVLEGVHPGVAEQLLLYLYGGVVAMTDMCPLGELTAVSDMYGIEGMERVINYNINRYCHFFHKPCGDCEARVVDAFCTCLTYNQSEMAQKCLQWINTNMAKVWRTKAFGLMGQEYIDTCCDTAIKDLNNMNVMVVMLECQKLNRNIPRLKWCIPVLAAVTRLMDKAIEYSAENFSRLLTSPKFVDIDKSLAYQMSLLEEIFAVVIKSLPIRKACQTFHQLQLLKKASHAEEDTWSEEFRSFICSLHNKCEDYMKLHIHQVMLSEDWEMLSKETQINLLQEANFVCVEAGGKRAPPRLTSSQHKRSPSELIQSICEPKLKSKSLNLRFSGQQNKTYHRRKEPHSSDNNSDKKSNKSTHLDKSQEKKVNLTSNRKNAKVSECKKSGGLNENDGNTNIDSSQQFHVSGGDCFQPLSEGNLIDGESVAAVDLDEKDDKDDAADATEGRHSPALELADLPEAQVFTVHLAPVLTFTFHLPNEDV